MSRGARAIVALPELGTDGRRSPEARLDEAAGLAEAIGVVVTDKLAFRVRSPKAATLFLVKQYALDHGKDGIRSNAVNADRIRSGLLTEEMVAARSKARGVSKADYMAGNLLKREVTAEDVAKAFTYLATATKTTAAVVTVDGGNIEASLR